MNRALFSLLLVCAGCQRPQAVTVSFENQSGQAVKSIRVSAGNNFQSFTGMASGAASQYSLPVSGEVELRVEAVLADGRQLAASTYAEAGYHLRCLAYPDRIRVAY